MQGKQVNLANLERKGPHKSMHCKFCKPPGVVTPEKPTRAQLETKTRIHLTHEAADLRLCNVHNEPGFPAVESEACICILEGDNPCPKCVPDKTRPPPKKKVCRCPKGAKPHPSMYGGTVPKKKKPVEEDDEFWWEKYSREHDAIAKETWAAYMAQRRKDKKLEKCQSREAQELMLKESKGRPVWYQKLSCQQMIYVEFLSTAIRLDSDENITDRTYFVLAGLGLHPRPQRKLLKRCLRYCHYNALRFLNQLHMLTKDEDPFKEGVGLPKKLRWYTWNEKLIMNSVCHLEFPALLRELMDRLPPLPREELLPQIPYPVFPKLPKKRYDSPYEEPIWQDRLNWVEKMKIDRLNRCRAHMDTKRVKIPALALVRRPSLIDARPPFLSQIEANERASRRLVKEKAEKPVRKHQISTFNSAVDVTAIAGIEASEISTTDKADTDDICVFLREPKEAESMEGEIEEADFFPEKEVKFLEEPPKLGTQVNPLKPFSEFEDYSAEGEQEGEDIPFKTPPKTTSGHTIQSPCPPPDATPGPPAVHYDRARRDLDITNEEICGFFPFVSSSTQTVKADFHGVEDDVEVKLRSAAAKLKEFADDEQDTEGERKAKKRKEKKHLKKGKCKMRRTKKKSTRSSKTTKKTTVVEMPYYAREMTKNEGEEEDREEGNEMQEGDEEEIAGVKYNITTDSKDKEKDSVLSDPDPDTDDEWSTRPPCSSVAGDRNKSFSRKKMRRRRGKKSKRKARKRKGEKREARGMELKEESGEYLKKKELVMKAEKETMTECYPGEYDYLYKARKQAEEDGQESEGRGRDVFRGNVKPLVEEIIKDLAEEGFHCASYDNINNHPLIIQLILYLKGEILNKKLREKLISSMQFFWSAMKGQRKFAVPELGVQQKRLTNADWNDKKWMSRLAKKKKDEFYFKVAKSRAEFGRDLYGNMQQEYFGTDRYLKIFYAYMTAKCEDALLRGIV